MEPSSFGTNERRKNETEYPTKPEISGSASQGIRSWDRKMAPDPECYHGCRYEQDKDRLNRPQVYPVDETAAQGISNPLTLEESAEKSADADDQGAAENPHCARRDDKPKGR